MKKLGIVFGGRSDEHEVSILSASSIINTIDKTKYEVIKIAISRSGSWHIITAKMDDITSLSDVRIKTLVPADGSEREGAKLLKLGDFKDLVDFVFPVLHGPYGEDGTIQGMFEMLDIPYAGCGVTSSALSMDKIFTKEVWIRAGLPVCKHKSINACEFMEHGEKKLKNIADELGYPLFVKPANMGSSVGITKAVGMKSFKEAMKTAFQYDSRVIIEEEILGRELETAVLGNNIISTAAVGEIVSSGEFYDYESKYKDGNTELIIPADIPKNIAAEIRDLAAKAYSALDGSGFARVDFFLEEGTGRVLINEMNTIPGFTKYSMFPALWNEAGVGYTELIERIIDLGYERYNVKNNR